MKDKKRNPYKEETIKVNGYSVGDRSVGIPMCPFEIDTGLTELSKEDREYIIKNILIEIYELHDNGTLYFDFSDELKQDNWDYTRCISYESAKQIRKEQKAELILSNLQ